MQLKVGDKAPDFEVTARQAGADRKLRLSDFAGKQNVVLFFYPRDFTPVCTVETCGFRDLYGELLVAETEVIGVSADDASSHDRFAKEHGIAFPLVSDPRRELAKLYGATSLLGDVMGVTARLTFVIDKSGRVAARFDSALRASVHLRGVRQTLAGMVARDGVPS